MKNLAINVITDDGTLKGVIELYGDTKIELEYVLSDIREPESRKIMQQVPKAVFLRVSIRLVLGLEFIYSGVRGSSL